jgi:predicted O-methyltransferase YrrM
MPLFFRIKKYLNYLLQAKSKYYLHSPFVYQFYLNVLEGKEPEALKSLHSLRQQMRVDKAEITIADMGTGNHTSRTVSELESAVSVRPKYGLLLYRLMEYFKPENVLEIGTSIGLSSSYLALGNNSSKIISLEGSESITSTARNNHKALHISNIEVVQGDFNETLTALLPKMNSVDLVFFDGNHTKQATLKYFNQCMEKANENSIFVFDDIYWSGEMTETWEEIKADPRITLTIDVYQFGICFFRKDKLAKEDFVLLY